MKYLSVLEKMKAETGYIIWWYFISTTFMGITSKVH